jgi:hypothetical protein
MKAFVRLIKSYWSQATQFTIFIIAIVCSMIAAPSALSVTEGQTLNLASVICGGVLLLIFIPLQFLKKKYLFITLSIGIAFFIVFVCTVYMYMTDYSSKTVVFNYERKIAGTENEMLPMAKTQKQKIEVEEGKPLTLAEVVFANSGNIEGLWSRETLQHNFFLLSVEFNICIVSLALTFIFAVQALKLYGEQ